MRAKLEKFDELCAKLVIVGMLHHFLAKARAGEIDFHDLANTGRWPIGHANDPVAEKERFIDIVGDHHGRNPLSTPKTDQNFLKLISREGIEHSKWLVEQQHFRSKGKGTRDAHPLAHALGKLCGKLMHRVGESDETQVVFADKSPLVTFGRVEYLIHPEHDVFGRRSSMEEAKATGKQHRGQDQAR